MGCGASSAAPSVRFVFNASDQAASRAYPLRDAKFSHSGAPPVCPVSVDSQACSRHLIGCADDRPQPQWYILSHICPDDAIIVTRVSRLSGSLEYVGTFPSMAEAQDSLPGFNVFREATHVLGYKLLGRCGQLLVATEAKHACTLPPNHRIYTLSAVEWVSMPLTEQSALGGVVSDSSDELESMASLRRYKMDSLLYCCETYNLAQPFPNNSDPHLGCREFGFNESLRRPFVEIPELRRVCCVALQGFAQYRPLGDVLSESSRVRDFAEEVPAGTPARRTFSAWVSMVVRKSCLNPGTRFNARGLNANFAPGNEYECELVVWTQADLRGPDTEVEQLQKFAWASYVWRRGTVPLRWASKLSGVSEDVEVFDEPWKTSEWYFHSLLHRYAYFHGSPEAFSGTMEPPHSSSSARVHAPLLAHLGVEARSEGSSSGVTPRTTARSSADGIGMGVTPRCVASSARG
eukprot:RCo031140